MHLCLQQHNKQVLGKWEALITLLHRLTMIDGTIVLYQMEKHGPFKPASNPALVQIIRIFDLQTYAPQLISFMWLDMPT